MKLAKRRSAVIKDLEDVEELNHIEFQINEDYIRGVIKDALSFIQMQDDQLRTIRGQRDKARREIKALKGGDEE